MREIDVVKLRSLAEAAKADWESRVPTMPLRRFHEATYPATVLALLDRLEQAEAALERVRGFGAKAREWADERLPPSPWMDCHIVSQIAAALDTEKEKNDESD